MSLELSIFRGEGLMENDSFGVAILAWVKNPRHATHTGENARSSDLVSIRYTKLEAHRHIGGDADNAIASYRKVLGMYDVGFSETFTEFFSETFERLVSIALARFYFNRHNLEIQPASAPYHEINLDIVAVHFFVVMRVEK